MPAISLFMPIADQLQKAREQAGLTQQDVAMRAGLSISVIAKIERGATPNPRWQTILAIARALNISLDSLKNPE